MRVSASALLVLAGTLASCSKKETDDVARERAQVAAKKRYLKGKAAPAPANPIKRCLARPQGVRAKSRVEGRFGGIQVGGAERVLFRTKKGLRSFYLTKPYLGYFLVLHRKQPLQLDVAELRCDAWERMTGRPVTKVQEARAGKRSASAWWAELNKEEGAAEAAKAAFKAYVDGPFGR